MLICIHTAQCIKRALADGLNPDAERTAVCILVFMEGFSDLSSQEDAQQPEDDESESQEDEDMMDEEEEEESSEEENQ